jgi:Skp family chaperone for outer membrane proteins
MATQTEEVATDEVADDAGFVDGFNAAMGIEKSSTAQSKEEPPTPAATATPVEPAKPANVSAKTEEPSETFTLSQTEMKSLLARLEEIDKLKASQDKAFGRLGTLQETLGKLQQAQHTGVTPEISDEDMAEISNDFPELGARLKTTLQKIMGKSRTSAAAPATPAQQPAFDPAPLMSQLDAKLAEQRSEIEKIKQQSEAKILTALHRDWKQVVNDDKFKLWLQGQSAEYRDKINASWDAEEIGGAIDEFKKAQQPAKPAPTAAPSKQSKANRLEAAVTPQGVKAPDTQQISDDEQFLAGFRSVRGAA